VNGTELYYELQGEGPAVVFIHGENHGIEMFDRQVAHFSTRYRCLTYYRRGHGRSASPPYGYSLWNQTLDLQGLLDGLGLGAVTLVAVAMSTPIAVAFTVRNQARVSGLVLASWYELDGYPELEKRRPARTSFPALNMRMYDIRTNEGQAALEAYMQETATAEFPILPDDPAQRSALIRMFTSHPPERYLHAAEFYTSLPCLIPELQRVACSILGICGKDDPSPDRPELLGSMSNIRQAWIDDARRFPVIEQPAAFNAILEEFLRETGNG
jgi:3-oxoadipate enol-lactonase